MKNQCRVLLVMIWEVSESQEIIMLWWMCHEGHLPSVQIKLGLTGRHLALHTNEFTLMSWLLPLLINFNTIFSSFLCRLSPRGTAPSITCQHPSHIPLWSWSRWATSHLFYFVGTTSFLFTIKFVWLLPVVDPIFVSSGSYIHEFSVHTSSPQ